MYWPDKKVRMATAHNCQQQSIDTTFVHECFFTGKISRIAFTLNPFDHLKTAFEPSVATADAMEYNCW